jgi:apolipoprotein N-acyltransferase
VGVVQGNINQAIKWTSAARERSVRQHEQLSLAFPERPDLIAWPETAVTGYFQSEPILQKKIVDLVRRSGFHLLFGGMAFAVEKTGTASPRRAGSLDSAYFLSPSLAATAVIGSDPFGPPIGIRHDKTRLVPFGEYVPLSSVLFFINKLVEGGVGDYIAGKEATIMEMETARIAAIICYEAVFPETVRRFANRGANLMVTLTNDAWFGQSAGPYQNFSMVIFRAIENRVPFARAANTGFSGFIDAHGRVLQRGDLFKEEIRSERLRPGMRKTLYTQYGDFFAMGCVILLFYFVLSICRTASPSAPKESI